MTARKTNKNSHRYASDDNHSATRKYIISTAYDLFREKGYAKASMSELARRINMDPSVCGSVKVDTSADLIRA